MMLVAFICFAFGIISVLTFLELITHRVLRINNKNNDRLIEYLSNLYEEKTLLFLMGGLVLIIMTMVTWSSALLTIIFPNELKYKPEGLYCYYVIDENDEAYPAKIEKLSSEYTEEDNNGNPINKTDYWNRLVTLYTNDETYDFSDEESESYEINSESFSTIVYRYEVESDDEGIMEEEIEFNLKLTKDVAYCPSFGKGITKIDYFELVLEIVVIVSEISVYFFTIYSNRKV